MLKKPITYTNYNGETVTEEFYFNITRSELAKMQLSKTTLHKDGTETGGMHAFMQDAIDSGSGERIIEVFNFFIDSSYGVKSADGRHHTKSPAFLEEFKSTPAYDALFWELVTNSAAGSEFVNGIMPAELEQEVTKIAKPMQDVAPAENVRVLSAEDFGLKGESYEPTEEEMLAAFEEPKDYSKLTKAEFIALPKAEKILAYKQKNQK